MFDGKLEIVKTNVKFFLKRGEQPYFLGEMQ